MNKMAWCGLAVLMLMAGCAGTPGVETTSLGDRPVLIARLAEKPLFVIVTDGAPGPHGFGVRNFAFIAATYDGQVRDPKSGKTLELRATSGGKTLRLGGRHYDLAEGRLFLVSVTTDPFRVQQFNVPEEELRRPTMADERIATFFQKK